MTPTDPQGAGTRTEMLVEWRNVYSAPRCIGGEFRGVTFKHLEHADASAQDFLPGFPRIAIERIETTTTITRYPLPPHAGEETKG